MSGMRILNREVNDYERSVKVIKILTRVYDDLYWLENAFSADPFNLAFTPKNALRKLGISLDGEGFPIGSTFAEAADKIGYIRSIVAGDCLRWGAVIEMAELEPDDEGDENE